MEKNTDQKIREALLQLDPANDGHWTTDGLPRIDVVEKLCDLHLKRGLITAAAPEFTRENRVLPDPAAPGLDTSAPGLAPEVGSAEDAAASSADQTQPSDAINDGPVEPEAQETDGGASDVVKKDYDDEIGRIGEELARLDAQLNETRKYREALMKRRDDLIVERDEVFPPMSQAEMTQQFLARQLAQRAERVGAWNAAAEALKHVPQPKSMLDQVLARRRGHGLNRPNPRPLMGQ